MAGRKRTFIEDEATEYGDSGYGNQHDAELELDEHEHLPWLEEADYDGVDHAERRRMLGFVLASIAALAAIIFAIWWASHRNGPETADGGTIVAAGDGYKDAPKDAGGKTFAGTGDSSFAQSQGQTKDAQVADGKVAEAAKPNDANIVGAKPVDAKVPDTADAGSVGVQIGAYSNKASADAAWTRLIGQYDILSGLHHRVQEGKADIGTVYRLQALTSAAEAGPLCAKLKAAGLACQVKN